MPQLFGHDREENAYSENVLPVRYWVETKAPSKQVLMRKGPWHDAGRVILTAPVIVLVHEDWHIQARYLNEFSTEAEIEEFTRKYVLDEQQRKWCFAVLEEMSPIDREE